MKVSKSKQPSGGTIFAALLLGLLALVFWRSFLPGYVHFSNDGPLGPQSAAWLKFPAAFTSMWDDLNDTGFNNGAYPLGITGLLSWLLGPVGVAKFFAPCTLFIAGLGAWIFFRALKLSPLAAMLGALATLFNSTFFSSACWGVGSQQIALGMNFLALALIVTNTAETPSLTRWIRLALAGFCVGINVMEAADIGAINSLLIAGFVFFKIITGDNGTVFAKFARATGSVVIVAVFASLIAVQTVVSLISTNIQGVVGTEQNSETKAAHWDWATQWSMPKAETLGIIVPGLFGYKMDTPNNMMPAFQDAYRGGAYWGGVGRTPALDRYFDGGSQGTEPTGPGIVMRFSGGENYCGILVALIAAWAIVQSFRRQSPLFTIEQRKIIWFWSTVLFLCLLFAWGRFAPFYALLYKLPYFSTIRNPCKFIIFFSWALVILFAYGVQALSQRQLNPAISKNSPLRGWWGKTSAFDRKWIFTCVGFFGASCLGWVIFATQQASFVKYLEKVGFPDAETAARMGTISSDQIAAFSLGQVGWFIILLAIAIVLVIMIIAGYFAGPRAKLGGGLLIAFLLFDLGRADLPYIIHWDYIQKYEVGSLNPIENFLRNKPYEHRVAVLPFEVQSQLRSYDNTFGGQGGIYGIEWAQHHFPYYNIQSLDLIQMSRMPEDLKAYLETFSPHTQTEVALFARHWELTNTRYLLGAAGFLNVLNTQLDPGQQRFRIAQRFDVIAKPGILQPASLEQLTVTPSPDGDLALFDFTGALPRAKLYSNWQVNTNDEANLKTLADLNFDPAKTVLISTPEINLPASATNENSGTVAFKSYASKHIVFDANATAPSVLLLNDKYDPNWKVTVDGQPAQLLRCNFIMRGVYLPPGTHTVEFRFGLPSKPLYITLAAIAVGVFLLGLLIVLQRGEAKN